MAESVAGPGRLLEPVQLGALRLKNRVVMAPLTRMRVGDDLAPLAFMADYYVQRASSGMILTESIAVCPYGAGYGNLPGLYEAHHVEAWTRIVDAVHRNGGLVVAQLFHPGRPKDESEAHGRPPGWAVTDPFYPDELTEDEIRGIIRAYGEGAERARKAGFDGVEVHSGSGTMLARFVHEGSNTRTDAFGGSPERRATLHLAILDEIAKHFPLDRVGLKLAPSELVRGAPDPTARESAAALLERLEPCRLAFIEFTRVTAEERDQGYGEGVPLSWLREHYRGNVLGVNGFSREDGEEMVAGGHCDAVVYGRLFISNPDLPRRFAERAPLAAWDAETFYATGPEGLIDYPALDA